jgi:hypothetical protein
VAIAAAARAEQVGASREARGVAGQRHRCDVHVDVAREHTTADWVRTIRHGVKRDGRPVMIMRSEEYDASSKMTPPR